MSLRNGLRLEHALRGRRSRPSGRRTPPLRATAIGLTYVAAFAIDTFMSFKAKGE